jgi:hypothetical protein
LITETFPLKPDPQRFGVLDVSPLEVALDLSLDGPILECWMSCWMTSYDVNNAAARAPLSING